MPKCFECHSTRHSVRLFWVPGRSRVRGNEIADGLAVGGTINQFVGPEPALGVSRQIVRKKIKGWLYNQRMAMWRGLFSTQRQSRKLISSLSPKSRIFTGLLTGHNILRTDLYIMEFINSPLCRRCEAEEETSARVFCECEAFASLRHTYLGSFSWTQRMVEV